MSQFWRETAVLVKCLKLQAHFMREMSVKLNLTVCNSSPYMVETQQGQCSTGRQRQLPRHYFNYTIISIYKEAFAQ